MKFEQLYRDTFSQVRTSADIDMEAILMNKPRKKRIAPLLLAAALCLALIGSAAAYAVHLFGLRDYVLPQTPAGPEDSNTLPSETDALPDVEAPEAVLSLQGYSNTPESRAMAEWLEFRDNYDTDGAIIAQVGNNPTGLEEKYGLYLVYTQEMADKLEEILAKYDLKLHTTLDVLFDEEWETRLGGKLTDETHLNNFSGYIYEDGTFHYDGEVLIEDVIVDYQFTRCVRGTLTDISYYPGDISDYEDWNYITSSGVEVTLAIGPSYSLLLADLGNSFVTINMFCGAYVQGDPLTGTRLVPALNHELMETFADSFHWTLLQ